MKRDSDGDFLRSLESSWICIFSHEWWKIFQEKIPYIAELGKLRNLNLTLFEDPPEIIVWSFLLLFPKLESLTLSHSWTKRILIAVQNATINRNRNQNIITNIPKKLVMKRQIY